MSLCNDSMSLHLIKIWLCRCEVHRQYVKAVHGNMSRLPYTLDRMCRGNTKQGLKLGLFVISNESRNPWN